MMTQPIQTFDDLTSKNAVAPAGGNEFETAIAGYESRALEMRARYARAVLPWMAGQFKRAVEAIKAHYRLRAAEDQLLRMSDRELADLGLCRADIAFAVRQPAYGLSPRVDTGAVETDRLDAANQNWRHAA